MMQQYHLYRITRQVILASRTFRTQKGIKQVMGEGVIEKAGDGRGKLRRATAINIGLILLQKIYRAKARGNLLGRLRIEVV